MLRYILLVFLIVKLKPILPAQNVERLESPVIAIESGSHIGSGFLVGNIEEKLYFLSAAHVIENPDQIEVRFSNGDKASATVVKADGDLDVVALACKRPSSFSWDYSFTLAAAIPPVKSELIIVGYPNGSLDINYASEIKNPTHNYSSDFFSITPNGISLGSSGSPVLNEDEKLLGMVLEENEIRASCVSKDLLIRMLKSWYIPINYLLKPQNNLNNDYVDPFIGSLLFVEGGEFNMGSEENDDEKPVHEVEISSFYLGEFEITQFQWETIMGTNPSHFFNSKEEKPCPSCPVESVTWYEVKEFIKRLNEQSPYTYRLPSEAEWEFAAGGGNMTRKTYAGTSDENQLHRYGNYYDDEGSRDKFDKTSPVGSYQSNPLGFYDMSGNVWEWCEDWYHENYENARPDGSPKISPESSQKVNRGGSWRSAPQGLRVAYRNGSKPGIGNRFIGFRIARSP